MSRGFVAIDRAALALCQGDGEVVCLFLMTRAQDASWSPERPEPSIDVGRTYWSQRSGISESHFRRLLDRLVSAGRAVVVHPGDRRTTKQIRLLVDVGTSEVVQPSANLPPTFRQPPTATNADSSPIPPTFRQPSANLPPQILETPPTTTQQPSVHTDVRPKVDLDALWSALTAWTRAPGAWKLTPKRRAHLVARLTDHGEAAVYRVAAWVRTSPHERAAFLRDRGDVDTLLRPEKFATYAAFSDTPAPTPNGRRVDAPLRRGDLFLMPSLDAHEGAIDTPYEAL